MVLGQLLSADDESEAKSAAWARHLAAAFCDEDNDDDDDALSSSDPGDGGMAAALHAAG
jgi:hypothetical protein